MIAVVTRKPAVTSTAIAAHSSVAAAATSIQRTSTVSTHTGTSTPVSTGRTTNHHEPS